MRVLQNRVLILALKTTDMYSEEIAELGGKIGDLGEQLNMAAQMYASTNDAKYLADLSSAKRGLEVACAELEAYLNF